MRNYKKIQPEVIVGIGNNTVFNDQGSTFRSVTKLHLHLEDWLGDDLMECFPCYIVTERVRNLLLATCYSGFEILDLELTKVCNIESGDDQTKPLPQFYWLKVTGQHGKDDIYLNEKRDLSISDKLLAFLQSHADLKYLDVEPEQNEFDNLLDQMIADSQSQNKSIPDGASNLQKND